MVTIDGANGTMCVENQHNNTTDIPIEWYTELQISKCIDSAVTMLCETRCG